MTENEISERIIGCAIKIHKALGPGLLESVYEKCLHYEIVKLGLKAELQKQLPVVYENIKIDCGYRTDLFVDQKVIVEIKAIEEFDDIHLAQILTYLRLSKCKLGLLINFNVKVLTNGIKRIANKL